MHPSSHVQALQELTDNKGIDLEDLGAASPLCSMLLLEALRFKGGPLHKARATPLVACCALGLPSPSSTI